MHKTLRSVVSGKVLLALLVFALAALLALTACSSSDEKEGAGSSAGDISVTVVVEAEVEGFENVSKQVTVPEGSSVYDALVASGVEVKAANGSYGMYIDAIAGLAVGDHGVMSGWVFEVNDEEVMDACDDAIVADGDTIQWTYLL